MGTEAFSRIYTWAIEAETVKVAQEDDGSRTVYGVASSGREDRMREIVHPKALLRQYAKAKSGRGGMPLLFMHDFKLPVGCVKDFGEQDGKVWTKSTILPAGKLTPAGQAADMIVDLIQLGMPWAQSVGFNPSDRADLLKSGDYTDSRVWCWGGVADGAKDFDLLETSVVTVGANQDATLHLAKGMGLDTDLPSETKAVLAFGDLPAAPVGHPWDESEARANVAKWASSDGSGAKGKVDFDKYKQAFLYQDEAKAEEFGGYKYPVADVFDGELKAVWGAVAAAMPYLRRTGGGSGLTPDDAQACEGVLKQYYMKFGKDFPTQKGAGDYIWLCGEADLAEEARFLSDLHEASGLFERTKNMLAHYAKDQGDPSQRVLSVALRPVSMAAEVLRAGRVLSDPNRAAVLAARDALSEVLGRDDASRGKVQGKDEEAAAEEPKAAPVDWRRALLGDLAEAV